MSEHFNQLTPAEAERLALLIEECGEVVQAACKVLRHGYGSRHPDRIECNRDDLERECGDLKHAMVRMCKAGDISEERMNANAFAKSVSVEKYLHHKD